MLSRKSILFCSALAAFIVALAVATAWYVLDRQEQANFNRVAASHALGAEALIRDGINGRATLVSGLANNWQGQDKQDRADWEKASKFVYDSQPGVRAIGWIDPSMMIRWVIPVADNEFALGFDLRSNPPTFKAAEDAKNSGKLEFSEPLESIHRGKGIAIYAPIHDPISNRFDGLIGSVLLFDPLLKAILPEGLLAQHDISVSVNNHQAYSSLGDRQSIDPEGMQSRSFMIDDLQWTIDVAPKPELLAFVHSRLLTIILGAGFVLSVLFALIVYYSLMAQNRILEDSEASHRLRVPFDDLPAIAFRVLNQPDWPFEYVSEGCESLTGYPRSDFEERHVYWGDLIVPEDRKRIWEEVQQHASSGDPFDVEYRITTSDGEIRWIQTWCEIIDIVDEDVAYIEGFLVDITKLKQAETLSLKSASLSEAIVEAAIEAVITVNADGTIETFNPAAQRMFGYDRDEIIGQNIEILVPANQRKHNSHDTKKYVETGELNRLEVGEIRYGLRKDGSLFPFELSVNEIKHPTDRMIVFLIRDVSSELAAEKEAQENRDRLAHVERLNTLGEMASGIAHELNQPLTAISNYMAAGRDLIDDLGPETKEFLKEAMDEASSESIRAGDIVRRLREFISKGEVNKQIHSLDKLIQDAAAIGLVGAREKGVDWTINIAPGSGTVLADNIQIQQVLVNLMRNAIEAMENQPVRHLTISAKSASEDFVEISIEDTGSGISEQIKDHLFTAFSSTKSDGMGLGLSICRTIIEDHNGKITAESGVNGGTIFRFTLMKVAEEISNE